MTKLSNLTEIITSISVRSWLLLVVGITLFFPNGVNSMAIIILFLHWIFFVPKIEKSNNFRSNKKYLFLLLSFYLINGISLFYSDDINSGLFDLQVKLSLLVFPIVLLCQNSLNLNESKKILYLFSVGVASSSLIAIVLSLIKLGRISANQELAHLIGLHASYYSLFVALSIFIIIEIILEKKAKPIHFLILTLLLFTISLLASRSIIIGLFVLAIIWFSLIRFNKNNLVFSGLIIIVVALFCMSYKPIKDRFYEAIDSKDFVELDAPLKEHRTIGKTYGGRAIRIAVWQCSFDLIKDNWLFGVGTGDAQNELQESYKEHTFEFAYLYNRYNAHNLFIQTIISSGILGLISIVSIFIFLIFISVKTKCIISFAFGMLFLFISLVESSLNVQSGVVFFALFSSLFISKFLYFKSSDSSQNYNYPS